MSQPNAQVTFRIDASSTIDLPPERIDERVQELQQELRELHLSSIEPASEPAQHGDKTPEAFTLGSLIIAIAPELLKQASSIIIGWLQREPIRVIRIQEKDGGPSYTVTGTWKTSDLAEIMKVLAKREAASTDSP